MTRMCFESPYLIYRGQEKQTKARDKVREVEGRVREAGGSDPL